MLSQEQNSNVETPRPETQQEPQEQHSHPAAPSPVEDATISQLAAQLISDMATNSQAVDTPDVHIPVPLPVDPIITIDHHAAAHEYDHDILSII